MAQKVNEATNFAVVQLIEKEPCLYDKSHPDYACRNKVDFAWDRISHDVKEPGIF
jgi:hypothetical protein